MPYSVSTEAGSSRLGASISSRTDSKKTQRIEVATSEETNSPLRKGTGLGSIMGRLSAVFTR